MRLLLLALAVLAVVQPGTALRSNQIQGSAVVVGQDEHKVTPLVQPQQNITRPPPTWPVNPKTGQRFIGVKEFVIVLHDNVLLEARELQGWCQVEYTQERASRLANIQTKQAVQYSKLTKLDADIQAAQGRIDDIEKSVALMLKLIARRHAGIRRANRKIRRIDTNWNITISGYTSQIGTAEQAIRDAEQIRSLLGVSSAPQVVGLLEQGKSRAGTNALKAKFTKAIRQVSVSSDITSMDSSMSNLTVALKKHLTELKIAKYRAVRARSRHIIVLRARVEPAKQKLAQLEKMVTASRLTVPDYEQDIAAANAEKTKAFTRLQSLENKIQQVNDTMNVVGSICDRQMENVHNRELLVERIHQVIKQRLIDGSIPERIMLRTVDNILHPAGLSKTPWSAFYDVAQTNSPLPNYASLPLRSKPQYNVDGSRPRNSAAEAPYGFPLPASVDPSSSASNLCAAYEFDEADGNPYAIDSSGFGHDGTLRHHTNLRLKGGSTGTGNALIFDGTQSYVDLGTLGNISQSLGEFTIEFRIRTLDTHPALSSVIKVVDDDTGEVLAIEPNGRVGKRLNNLWPVGQQATTDLDYEPGTTLVYLRDSKGRVLAGHVKAPYFDNRWHTLRWVVMNSTLNQMAFFMDGQLYPWIASIEQGPAEFAPSFKRNVFLGAGNNHGRAEGFFDGALDAFRMFCGKQVLTAFDPCCRVCNGTQACGDMCIAADAKCLIPVGCACPTPTVTPTHAPTESPTFAPTSSPTRTPEFPQWRRGESIVNEVSMFPGQGALVPARFSGPANGTLRVQPAAPAQNAK